MKNNSVSKNSATVIMANSHFRITRIETAPFFFCRLVKLNFFLRAATRYLNRFPTGLSYRLHLLISSDCVEVNHGGRLSAIGSLRALAVVEGDQAPYTAPCLRPGLPSVQMDAFKLQGSQQVFDADVVDEAPFVVH